MDQNKNWIIFGPDEGLIEIQTRRSFIPDLVSVVAFDGSKQQRDMVHKSNNIILGEGVYLLGEL